jgi:hypothetical protein
MLLRYNINEVVQWLQHLVVPAADLFILFYAEIQELGVELRL